MLIRSPTDGHLGDLHLWAVVNGAAVKYLLEYLFSLLWGYTSRMSIKNLESFPGGKEEMSDNRASVMDVGLALSTYGNVFRPWDGPARQGP